MKHTYEFQIGNTPFIIDAMKKGNRSRFINHSCDPNTIATHWNHQGRSCVFIFACKKINAGEEITYGYRMKLDDSDIKVRC